MESFTDQDLLDELLAINPVLPERHGGVTAREYAQAKGCSKRHAHEVLRKLEQNGMLAAEYNVDETNHRVLVWYKNGE